MILTVALLNIFENVKTRQRLDLKIRLKSSFLNGSSKSKYPHFEYFLKNSAALPRMIFTIQICFSDISTYVHMAYLLEWSDFMYGGHWFKSHQVFIKFAPKQHSNWQKLKLPPSPFSYSVIPPKKFLQCITTESFQQRYLINFPPCNLILFLK